MATTSPPPEATAPRDTDRLRRALTAIDRLQARLRQLEERQTEPIAVVGIGCRFPGGANSPRLYWELLDEGRDAICRVPADRWDADRFYDPDRTRPGRINARASGFLDTDVYAFEPTFFGISPREATQLDPQQRLLLEVTWEALEYGNIVADTLYGSATGVFVGISSFDYAVRQLGMQQTEQIGAYVGTGALLSPAAGRLSYALGLTGPSTAVDTACSSSLVALHLACQSLRLGECELALTGGVNLMLDPELTTYFSTGGMLSSDGRCKTFDASADGYVRGEGCGVLVLKRLSAAVADGDTIHGLIRGSALNQDGASGGLTVPSGPSQERVIRQALAAAGVEPHQVDYIEAHGTGTPLGDPIEVAALGNVFAATHSAQNPLWIGSAKTSLGHLEAAAGMAGVIKVLLALKHGRIPRHLHLREPNPRIAWDQLPFRVPVEPASWPSTGSPRVAGVSAFGFSGTNGHIIIQEAPAGESATAAPSTRPVELLTLSARSEAALRDMARQHGEHLARLSSNSREPDLADICATAHSGRARFAHRISVVAATAPGMAAALTAVTDSDDLPAAAPQSTPPVAFLYTGQGAQYAGMGRELYRTSPVFRDALDACARILADELETPLLEVLYDEATPLLDETAYTQPALFALGYALQQLWQSWGVRPAMVMGHSIGQYAAACAAGVFSLEDALGLVARRGRLMQELPRNGAMFTAFAAVDKVEPALADHSSSVTIAAINGPQSVVLSGERSAVECVVGRLQASGIETRQLNVSHAFHSPCMDPMLAPFRQAVESVQLHSPQLELICNVTGEPAADGLTNAAYWSEHIRKPVQFAASIAALQRRGCGIFVEIGPRPALLGMARACLGDAEARWLPSLHPRRPDWQQLLESVGGLYECGADIDWAAIDQGRRGRALLPTYPFQRRRYAVERPASAATAMADVSALGHPLLDRCTDSPLLDKTLFETRFHIDVLPLLADHRLYDAVVVSGASHVSLVMGAAAQLLGEGPLELRDIVFQQALVVPEGGCTVQLGVEADAGDGRAFELISRTTSRPEARTHVRGRIRGQTPGDAPAAFDPDATVARCTGHMDADQFVAIQAARRITLGPRYQWTECIDRGDGEAMGTFVRPAAVDDAAAYQLHPGLIDACFGLLAVAVELEVEDTFIPFGIQTVRVHRRPVGQRLHARIQVGPVAGGDTVTGDIQLQEADGSVVAEFIGFMGRQASRAAVLDTATASAVELYRIAWQPAGPASAPPKGDDAGASTVAVSGTAAAWLVLADRGGTGAELARRLRSQGHPVQLVHAGQQFARSPDGCIELRPSRADDFRRLLAEHLDALPAHVVQLWGLDADSDDLDGAQELTCAATLHLVQALAAAGNVHPASLCLASRLGQAVLPADRSRAEQGLIAGLGKVVALELPELHCICVDVDGGSAPAAQQVLASVEQNASERQVAWRGQSMYVARMQPETTAAGVSPPALDEASTYLITGGTGALGLRLGAWMADAGARHLLLLSRSGARSAASIQAISDMQEAGVQVVAVAADASERDVLGDALDRSLADMPPLRGVVHAAGVLDDGMLAGKTWEQFRGALAAKVAGAWNVHEYTARLPLDFFVAFSSMAALLGNQGQASYAAANAFLDSLAHHRRSRGLPALSINWGPWAQASGMVNAAAGERLARHGFRLLDAEDALATLGRLLGRHDAGQVAVVSCDWTAYQREAAPLTLLSELAAADDAGEPDLLTLLDQASPGERSAVLQDFVAATARQVIGLDATDVLDPDVPLMETGMDSLMTVEIRNRLGRALDASLPVSLLFNHPSIRAVCTYVAQEILAADAPPAADDKEGDTGERFAYLDDLDEQELENVIKRDLEDR